MRVFASGSAYSFLRDGTSWSQTSSKNGPSNAGGGDYLGWSVSVSNPYAISNAYYYSDPNRKGAAFIYETDGDLSLPIELSSFTAQTLSTLRLREINIEYRTRIEE